jgi:protoheme IX farnesyltransferase
MASKARIGDYYQLAKPGIIYGNLLTAAAGFLLACRWHIHLELLISTLLGIGLIIGSACVANNYIDRNIDSKMNRTKKRALVEGIISPTSALSYSVLLGTAGLIILIWQTNTTTVLLGLIGYLDYVLLYGVSKRRFSQGTIIGSISGAIPPAAGYTAVTGHFNTAAALLFLIQLFWQLPHFYAIAIYRYDDYKSAGLPVLPVKKNIKLAKRRIMYYILAFTASSTLLTFFGYTGYIYLAIVTALGFYWLGRGIKSYDSLSDKLWARKMFLISLFEICCLSVAISLGSIVP